MQEGKRNYYTHWSCDRSQVGLFSGTFYQIAQRKSGYLVRCRRERCVHKAKQSHTMDTVVAAKAA
jgi:hypothetical protein